MRPALRFIMALILVWWSIILIVMMLPTGDGSIISYQQDRYVGIQSITMVDVERGLWTPPIMLSGMKLGEFTQSPNLRHLAFFDTQRNGALVSYDLRTHQRIPMTDRLNAHSPKWSPTGEAILWYTPTIGDVGMYHLDENRFEILVAFRCYAGALGWSTAGEAIIYGDCVTELSANEQALYRLDLATGTREQLTPDWLRFSFAVSSPDERYIAYHQRHTRGGQFDIYDFETGDTVTIFADAGMQVAVMAWSPDSSEIAYKQFYSALSHIMLYNVEDRALRQLNSDPIAGMDTLNWID